MDGGTEKELITLLIEQVEFCDVLLLNKCDLVGKETLDETEEMIEVLQPRTEIIRTEHGAVNPEVIVDTGRFDFEEASHTGGCNSLSGRSPVFWRAASLFRKLQFKSSHTYSHQYQSPGWMQELQEPHESAEEEHGVTSFVFESRRPFQPERFAELLDEFPTNVVRSKDCFWLAGREDMALGIDAAGHSIRIAPAGEWIAALPTEEREAYFEANPQLEEVWDEEWGDRGTQLVLIGTDMDHDALRTDLDAATLTDGEMAANWDDFEDRFPTFDFETADEQTEATDTDDAEEVGLAD